MTLVKIGTGSRIPPPAGPFRNSFCGTYLPPMQIFSRNLVDMYIIGSLKV